MDPAEQVDSRSALAAKTPMGTLKAALDGMDTTAAGNLLAGQAHTITIALKMQEEAGNEYQNKSIGTDFSIQLIATQLTYEVDSFDELYDETSVFPVLSVAKTAAISSNTTSEDLTIAKTGEIESATVPAAAANTLFDSMKDDEAESNELTLTLNVAKTGETTTSAGTTVALEIDMTAVMESTKAGVTSTTTDNVTTFSNYITIEYNLGAGLSGVTATHKGNAMVNSTDTADDAGHGIYSYDAESGILTIKTKTLSPFAVSYDKDTWDHHVSDGIETIDTDLKTMDITSAAELAYFAKYVTQYNGYTVNIKADIDLGEYLWVPASSFDNGTINGENHTISNMTVIANNAYGNGFFSRFGYCGLVVMNDLTFANALVQRDKNATRSGNIYGIIAGYAAYYGSAEFNNVTVRDSEITGFGKISAFIGMAEMQGGHISYTDCTIANTTVHCAYNGGGFAGLIHNNIDGVQNTAQFTNCTADVTLDSVGIGDLVEIDGYEGLYSFYYSSAYYADTAVFFNEYNAPGLPDNMDAIVHNTAYNMNLD